jgi:peptide/nickel transport system substrate-binding protein
MKKHRPFTTTCLVVLLLVTGALAGCRPRSEPKILRYGLTLAPSGIDPHIHASAELGIPLTSVYDTLIVRDPDGGEFLPSLAESWEVSEDGRTYTFTLRRDVHFHDNTRLDAQAVVDNFEYVLNPGNNSQKAASMLGPIQQVNVLEDYKLQIHMDQPFAPLLDSLSQVYLGIASPTALDRWGPAEYQFHQVGSGPYRFIEYIPNDHLLLERNPDYNWGPAIYQAEQASIPRIEFRFFEDEATRALALERGEVDILGEIPPQDAVRLDASEQFTLKAVPIPGQPLQYFFNTELEPTNDPLVRRGLLSGINRPRILSTVFRDLSPIARGPLSTQTFDQMLPATTFVFDTTMATQLLEQAGWLDLDLDGLREQDEQELQLKIIVPPWGSNPEVAQLIKVDWEALGAQVEIEVVASFGALRQAQDNGAYHAIGLNFFGTDPDLIRPFFESQGFFNWTLFQSDSLDELLISAASEIDPTLRNELYSLAIQSIDEQALLIPIRDYVNLVVYSNDVTNLRFSAQGWFPYLIDLEFTS